MMPHALSAGMLCLSVVAALLPESARGESFDLIADPRFGQGFTVSAPTPGRHVLAGVFRPDPTAADPVWRLVQWSSRFPLQDFSAPPGADGSHTLQNEGKLVCVLSSEADVTLVVNGKSEYAGRARRVGEPWVHLLVSQEFAREAWLDELSALRLHVQIRVPRCERDASTDYDPHIHAAQVPLFITVQNRNKSSAGYGDYYHFGVPLFDDRERMPSPLVAPVSGTGKLMYITAAAAWSAASAHDADWVTFEGDVLPQMLQGLQAAWERGFLKDSRNLHDYRPAGICIGWEVPGVFNVTAQLRGLKLIAERK